MLIKKYGITIGDKLAEGIIEIGMTKDMVVDALGYDDIVLHSYRISNSMDWNDNAIEIWEYDPSKAKQYMDKEMGESAALLNLYLGLASSMGFDYKSEISKNVTYKYMKFKNNRLVEVKDNSIYDDIDRSSGSLYNSFLSYGSSPIGIALFSFRRQIPSADIADLANFPKMPLEP